MSPIDLLWFPPLMLAIAIVLGATGEPGAERGAATRRTFVGLSAGVIGVGVLVHAIALWFAG